MKLKRLNKMFAAAVPMLVMLIGMYWPNSDVTAADLNRWWEAALIVATPILVYVVPNQE